MVNKYNLKLLLLEMKNENVENKILQLSLLVVLKNFKVFRSIKLTIASWISFFPISSGECRPPELEMSFVSLGFVSSSFAKPGVSVSGGNTRVCRTLVPTSSMCNASAKPRTAHLPAL